MVSHAPLLCASLNSPFRFILPVGISGSFAESGGSGSQTYECSIAYEFNTYVSIPGLLAFDIKHTQPLVVCSAPR